MSAPTSRNPITMRPVLFRLAGMEAVEVRRDVAFPGGDGAPLALDLYAPAGPTRPSRLPAVVLVAGFPDEGMRARVGCRFKEMESNVSWARLIAASGLAAVTATNRAPAADLLALLGALRRDAEALGIDADRIGVWASSGNAPLALSLLLQDSPAPVRVRCAVLLYGYTLDLAGADGVARAARTFGFANACASRTVSDLRADTPLLLARAGQDACAGLNDALDRFVAASLTANLPVTCVNNPSGPHAFDLFDDNATTCGIVREILAFLRRHLRAAGDE